MSILAGKAGVAGYENININEKTLDKKAALFNEPTGVAVDAAGNVYVADSGNNAIRKIAPDGVVSTFAGSEKGEAGSTSATEIVKGTDARFSSPARLAIDTDGSIYVTDRGNSTIRKITAAGLVSTFAGTAGIVGSTDGTGSTASFLLPIGIAVDTSHNVYVGDGKNTIRKITSAGVVTTLAGTADTYGAIDGEGKTVARFNNIGGLAVDAAGNVYVADQGNNLIRKVTSSGVVSLFSGIWGRGDSVDGNGGAAGYRIPTGIAIDSTGKNLYVTDYASATIRKIVQP